jgi:hypothetical protein
VTWIPHGGGPCPVMPDTWVNIQCRFEDECPQLDDIYRASDWDWSHSGSCTDIIAYSIVAQKDTSIANT